MLKRIIIVLLIVPLLAVAQEKSPSKGEKKVAKTEQSGKKDSKADKREREGGKAETSYKADRKSDRGGVPPVVRAAVGTTASADDGSLRITLVDKKQNYSTAGSLAQYRDSAVNSPKSANIHPDGTKYYVNSLEGCQTIVYDLRSNKRLKVINHRFGASQQQLWAPEQGLFKFTHYPSRDVRTFRGKPVESTFSHGGRYLWVPYYRRDFDLNAQDPSAIAVIDTRSDEIIRLFDTGPLPKMIACSHDGSTIAVSHWGNNTVGLIDVSSATPADWRYLINIPTPRELELNFSLTSPVDRDRNSGLLLRGTVFTPDDRYLLVGSMAGGGICVIDVAKREYKGKLTGSASPRHLVIGGGYLYLSSNVQGLVQRKKLDEVIAACERLHGGESITLSGWEECRVGGGARTLELSPSGNYAFVACNSASKLCVVDTRKMKMIAQIDVDSYPVGLALSDDGTIAIVTSQGRKGNGGNAVNIYKVEYSTPEPVPAKAEPQEECTQEAEKAQSGEANSTTTFNLPLLLGIGGALVALLLVFYLINRKKK